MEIEGPSRAAYGSGQLSRPIKSSSSQTCIVFSWIAWQSPIDEGVGTLQCVLLWPPWPPEVLAGTPTLAFVEGISVHCLNVILSWFT
jgi:hypothetical protein